MNDSTDSVVLPESEKEQVGTYDRLDALLAEQRRTNQLLEWLGAVLGHPVRD